MSKVIPITQVKISEDEIQTVVRVLRSGKLRAGEKCEEFEQRFAEYVGAKYAVTVNSGTSALYLSYLVSLKPSDEILVPSFTFFATASMAVAMGARPVFCDIDPFTFTIDLNEVETKVNPKVKAIAPVHIFGNACDIKGIQFLASKYHLKIIWDAAQAHGTKYDGKDVGCFNDIVCYSFYPSKNMTTGEGGMIVTNDRVLYETLKLLRSQGQPKKCYHTLIGYNFRMTDFQAAIGVGQLAKLPKWVSKRRNNASYLTSGLKDLKYIHIQKEQPNSEHSYHQYAIKLDSKRFKGMRNAFVSELMHKGIQARTLYSIPLHQQPIFKTLLGDISLPNSEDLAQNILNLPVHPFLSTDELDKIVFEVRKTYHKLLSRS